MLPSPEDRIKGWNLTMEVLASLPCEPVSVPIRGLMTDFGLTGQSEIRDAIKTLQNRGHEIETFHGPERGGGNHVWVNVAGWKKAVTASKTYWNRVYGIG